jgi:hypothetical protein
MLYEDFPEELGELFPIEDIAIPPVVRTVIADGWDAMDLSEQKLLVAKLKLVKEPVQRALIAVFESTKELLTQPPEDIIF